MNSSTPSSSTTLSASDSFTDRPGLRIYSRRFILPQRRSTRGLAKPGDRLRALLQAEGR